MSHEESHVNVSFDQLSEGTLPLNVHVVHGFYPQSFLDRCRSPKPALGDWADTAGRGVPGPRNVPFGSLTRS